jgi:hypothetical protein
LAIGRPIGTVLDVPSIACDVDHTVVSVGPYMLSKVDDGAASRNCCASTGESASPPTSMRRRPPSAARDAGSATSIAASDGVHWKCVTRWRTSSPAIE